MSRKLIPVGAVALVISLILTACGVPQEEYDAAIVELDARATSLENLQAERDKLENEYEILSDEVQASEEATPPAVQTAPAPIEGSDSEPSPTQTTSAIDQTDEALTDEAPEPADEEEPVDPEDVAIDASPDGDESGVSDDVVTGIEYPADSPLSRTDADVLFSAAIIPVFELELPNEEWQWLQRNPVLEEYREATLTFEGQDMGLVGLRFKGSVGSLEACVDSQGNLLPNMGCSKLSLKIKFDFVDDDKRFFGVKRLNFNSMTRDPTKMVEKISFGLFRQMGILAPRVGWAVLTVNGTSQGLFSLIEQIDGRFTDDRWPDGGDGNLYKSVWPLSSSEEYYATGSQTNSETATHEQMVAFSEAIATAAPSDRLTVLEEWTDVNQLYNFLAVNDAIVNWDSITTWYCEDEVCSPHNYYWYQHETDNKFTLIPWDVDQTLRPLSSPAVAMWNRLDEVPHWTVSPDDCSIRYPTGWGSQVSAAGCFSFFQALVSDQGRYAEAIQNLLDGPFDIELLKDQIDQYADFIRETVAVDPIIPGIGQWERAVRTLKNDLIQLTRQLEYYRDSALANAENASN